MLLLYEERCSAGCNRAGSSDPCSESSHQPDFCTLEWHTTRCLEQYSTGGRGKEYSGRTHSTMSLRIRGQHSTQQALVVTQLCLLSVTTEQTQPTLPVSCSSLPAQSPSTYPREPSHAASVCWVRQSAFRIPRRYTLESSRRSISQALCMDNSEIPLSHTKAHVFPHQTCHPKQRLSTVPNTNTSD